MSLAPRSTQQGVPSGQGVSRVTTLSPPCRWAHAPSRATLSQTVTSAYPPATGAKSAIICSSHRLTMNAAAPSYSKTRLGADQAAGLIALTPRRKRIVYLVVAGLVVAGIAIGVWSGGSR